MSNVTEKLNIKRIIVIIIMSLGCDRVGVVPLVMRKINTSTWEKCNFIFQSQSIISKNKTLK